MADEWADFAPKSKDDWAEFSPTDASKYQKAAREEIAALKAKGVPIGGRDLARQVLQGALFNFGDEALAGLQTPIEMVKRGTFNPAEAYNYAKARENVLAEEAKKEGGIPGMAAEFIGGMGSGGSLVSKGVSFVKPGQGLLTRAGAMAGDAAAYGALSGAGDAEGADRLTESAKGAAIGGALGGALGIGVPALWAAGKNVFGWALANHNPEKYAMSQVARGVSESGMSPAQIAAEVRDGVAAGHPYTVADAMGNAGQRMLSTVARNPGAGRTAVVDFLENRQAGQGRRIANILAEGFDAPETSAATAAMLKTARSTAARANYGAADAAAGAVDVSPALNIIERTLQPGASSVLRLQTEIADNIIEKALRNVKGTLTDGKNVLSDYNQVLLAKQNVDAMIEGATPTVQRMLIPIRQALDDALSIASAPYAKARDEFRAASKVIDAIDTGKAASRAGRSEDTIRQFGGLSPNEQQAFRVGYVDPLIEQTQGAAMGANKARPFTSDAMQTEIGAFGVTPKYTLDRLGRENRMFETRATATGGSKTADNLADSEALKGIPSVLGALLSGHPGMAARTAVVRTADSLSGNTAAVREHIAKMLLSGDAKNLPSQIQEVLATQDGRKKIVQMIMSGALGGSTQQIPAISR